MTLKLKYRDAVKLNDILRNTHERDPQRASSLRRVRQQLQTQLQNSLALREAFQQHEQKQQIAIIE